MSRRIVILMMFTMTIAVTMASGQTNQAAATTREKRQELAKCLNACRRIDDACAQWAIENNKPDDALVTFVDLKKYLPVVPKCPAGGTYSVDKASESPKCSVHGTFKQIIAEAARQDKQAVADGSATDADKKRICYGNLRTIDGAKEVWALSANKEDEAEVVIEEMVKNLPDKTLPTCPSGGKYEPGKIGQNPKCSVHGSM